MRYEFDYQHYSDVAELSPEDGRLVEAAYQATRQAHAPYSNFCVGAAARLRSGRILTGSNQESEVYPSGLCAERTLLYAWQAHDSEDVIEALAIASNPSQRECYPCGGCRQVLLDSERRQGSPIRILMCGGGTVTEVPSAECLLPFQFKL